MTTWTEASDSISADTWTPHTPVVPVVGNEEIVVGDEWHELYTMGYDFTPWSRVGETETTWTENS